MRELFKYLRGYRKQLFLGPAFKLTEAVFELIVPLVMANIIDFGVAAGNRQYIFKQGGILVALGFTGLCCAFVCQYFASVASQGVGTDLRNALFAHINTLSHEQLDKVGTGTLITRMTNDINQLQYAVAMLIRLVVRAPFLVIGAIVMAMIIDMKLSLIVLAATPLIVGVLWFVMSRSIPLFKTIQSKLDRISLITREDLEGARVIRAFARQDREKERFTEASADLADTAVSVGRFSALLNPMTTVIMNLAVVALMWFGGIRVNGGDLSQGELIAFINYMNQILLALVVVANLVVTFTRAAASASRVNELFNMKSTVTSPSGAVAEGEQSSPAVEFKNVSFGYGGENALKNINLTVRQGETLGVIGGTGSGKSTLARLIPRFYDVNSGQVLVEGTDVRQWDLNKLRKRIGFVPQKAELASGTVRSNMLWGGGDDESMRQALDAAQADFVFNNSDGANMKIEQGGRNLSGGQRQRLTVARALAKNPDILILDDSSSALDAATDLELRRALEKRGGTVIMISQRVGTLRHADRIAVLDDGALVDAGTHDELYGRCGIYREICASQLEEEEAKA